VMELWGGARSSHALTEDTPDRVERALDAVLIAEVDGALVGAVIAAFDGWLTSGGWSRRSEPRVRRRAALQARVSGGADERRQGRAAVVWARLASVVD
jgi:hypothetical protein